ncbi:MAG: PP0621 family protein [Caldimicrobium sp.]
MKLLIILLLFFIVFWYYRKKKQLLKSEKQKQKALRVEMRACENCGVFFPESEGYKIKRGNKEVIFCSEKCLKEFLSEERI